MLRYQDLSHPHNKRSFTENAVTQIWYICNATFFRLSPHFLYGWRTFLLRLFGAKIGNNVKVRPSARITLPWKIAIGDNSYIGDDVVLYSLDQINIGQNVSVSFRSFLCTGTHDFRDVTFPLVTAPIAIDDQSWIAADVFVFPGTHVGTGAVVAARSTIKGNLEANSIYAGNPARHVGTRNPGVSSEPNT